MSRSRPPLPPPNPLLGQTVDDVPARPLCQPVTPDREALIEVAAAAIKVTSRDTRRAHALWAVDAFLPLLTEALDRARQQGREEAAAAIEAKARDLEFMERQTAFQDTAFAIKSARVASEECAALARGGPNRKDKE